MRNSKFRVGESRPRVQIPNPPPKSLQALVLVGFFIFWAFNFLCYGFFSISYQALLAIFACGRFKPFSRVCADKSLDE